MINYFIHLEFFIVFCTLSFIKKREKEQLLAPVEYYKSLSGKNTRSILCEYIGRFYGIDKKVIESVKYIINECHNSSLVIDDIQDNSMTRRNYPCAHLVYGIPITLNAGYLNAFKVMNELPDYINSSISGTQEEKDKSYIKTSKLIINHLYNIHIGQGLDIYWTINRIIPCIDEYIEMIEYKTGILFQMIVDLYTATKPEMTDKEVNDLKYTCKLMCIFFQIRDDYVNITDPSFWKEKGICEDFDEKKQSFLIIQFYHSKKVSQDLKTEFFSLFYKLSLSKEEKKKLLQILLDTNIICQVYEELCLLKTELEKRIQIPFLFNKLYVKKVTINPIESIR
jgi:geranylgeranyl diphosphate synthase, type III